MTRKLGCFLFFLCCLFFHGCSWYALPIKKDLSVQKESGIFHGTSETYVKYSGIRIVDADKNPIGTSCYKVVKYNIDDDYFILNLPKEYCNGSYYLCIPHFCHTIEIGINDAGFSSSDVYAFSETKGSAKVCYIQIMGGSYNSYTYDLIVKNQSEDVCNFLIKVVKC